MTDERQGLAGRRPLIVTMCLLGALALVWILGTAPSGGPDEPVHLVRGAALVRGEPTSAESFGAQRFFDLPAWIGHPDSGCFDGTEDQPASCATAIPRPSGEQTLATTAWRYPVWGHIAPGLGTYLPASIGNQAARVFDAVLPIGLIGAAVSLARRRSRAALGAVTLAVTPMAWFSIIVVNPSGLVIAGGLALWVGLLHAGWLQRQGASLVALDRLTAWTIAAGWAAAVLPRRDGMIWAALIIGLCAAAGVVDLRAVGRRLGIGPMVLVGLSTLATLVWAATADTSSSKLLVAMPLVPLAGVGIRRLWTSTALQAPGRRAAASVAGLVGVGAALFAVMSMRSAGFDSDLFGRLVAQSGVNLEEAIGLLGWLDTPLPRTALFLWLATLGVLAGAALTSGNARVVAMVGGLVIVGVVAAWVLEMNQGNTSGTYWQGRYSLPLLIGAPVILGWSIGDDDHGGSRADIASQRSLLVVASSSAMLVMTMAFGASMRRWGVGTSGSIDPRNWDTYGASVPPVLLLALHAALAVAVVAAVLAVPDARSTNSMPSSGRDDMETFVTHEQ